MKPTCSFTFNLTAWNIVANKALSAEDWQKGEPFWAENSALWQENVPKLAFLPPLKRRRLSPLARLFFESAWELTAESENLPVVYASANSEINRSFALWDSLLKEGDVSPTSFSLSVHNALVGQWSEMRQVKNEITAITACQDNLETALLEAYLLLNEGQKKVLVVVAEEPLKTDYNAEPVYCPPFGYALALVVEKGTQYQLSLYAQALENIEKSANRDNALTFVQQHHLARSQWQTPSSRYGAWLWQKN